MFDREGYECGVNVYTPITTPLIEPMFVIDSNVPLSHLSFDIVDNMMAGETSTNGHYLINGTIPPLVVSPPIASMYWIALSIGRRLNYYNLRDNITFNLFAYVRTTDGEFLTVQADVTLYERGNTVHAYTL